MQVLTVCNQKGGVGKTCTAVNLASAMATGLGLRVLLFDFDPQASATEWLRVVDSDHDDGDQIFGAFSSAAQKGPQTGADRLLAAVEATAVENLDLLPSDGLGQGRVNDVMTGQPGGYLLLREILQAFPEDRWDVLIIDTGPSANQLHFASLAAADWIIIMVESSTMSLTPVRNVLQTLRPIQQRGTCGRLLRVVQTRADVRTGVASAVDTWIRDNFGADGLVAATRIREDTRLTTASGHRQPIDVYAPRSRAAADYAALAQDVATAIHLMPQEKAS